ncbi:RAP domain-containing protein, chloroplastic isoform X2 [Momordica charantia]|uniref:RAP domain-containing protein, chloroplastic isoform X2 n=1 Tax=Momordica charantia TaxID=3673 RepID=A0A6J1DP44_MOMCH|nr:RAP domain-containing protein, chloroplastic isoform X2 [Momordica charantia]
MLQWVISFQLPKKKKKQMKSKLLEDTEGMEWCLRARKVALRSIEARGLTSTEEDLFSVKKKKNNKKKKKKKKILGSKDDRVNKHSNDIEEGLEFDSDEELDLDLDLLDSLAVNDTNHLSKSVSMMAGGMFEQRKEKTMEEFVHRLSQFSGPSDRKKEINLNRAIVEAQTVEEALEVISDMILAVGKGLSPSPLSPLNIATALHRIAKNMDKVSMLRSHRLAFARRREMSMLVGIAMTALPECSAQGISNIAWALPKIGGDQLYLSEMDRVAEVTLTKIEELNSQNVANIAGAFASMQHSASELFSELAKRASDIVYTFQEQELAQVLWAFASLNESVDLLLESLDKVYNDKSQFKCLLREGKLNSNQEIIVGVSSDLERDGALGFPVLKFNRNQLGNIAWSYAVFGEMNRSFFSYIWRTINYFEKEKISEQHRNDIMFTSQLYLVNYCLKREYPHLQLSLSADLEEKVGLAGKTKRFNQKTTSSFQKEVARLLISTGREWIREYVVDGYTLDAVLVDEKVALEIDGPTHFSRNTGVPLGHTVLKRRYITAAGWKAVSVSHQEWEELHGEVEQLNYLREILKDHLD